MEFLYFIFLICYIVMICIDCQFMQKGISQVASEIEEVIYTSVEPSLLQCVQRCRFIDKTSAVDFTNKICKCLKLKKENLNIETTLTGIFITKKIKEDKDNYSFFTDKPHKLVRNTLLATIGKVHKEYKLQFKFRVDVAKVVKGTGYNILHLTTDINDGDERKKCIPAVYFFDYGKSTDYCLDIATQLNGGKQKTRVCKKTSFFDDWVSVDVSQQLVGSGYEYVVKINGEVMIEGTNTQPMEYHNVYVLASDNYHSAIGSIKALYIQGLSGIKLN